MISLKPGEIDEASSRSLQNHLNLCNKKTIVNERLRLLLNHKDIDRSKYVFGINEGIQPLNDNGHGMGCFSRVYLAYLIRKALNLHRFYGYDDKACYSTLETTWKQLEAQDLAEIENDTSCLRELYDHTQRELKRVLGPKKTVTLFRGFRDDQRDVLIESYKTSREKQKQEMPIPLNTFDFFKVETGGFNTDCFLVLEIPVEAIVVCIDTVEGFHSIDGDYLVAFDSPTGLATTSLEALHDNVRLKATSRDIPRKDKGLRSANMSIRSRFKSLFNSHGKDGY